MPKIYHYTKMSTAIEFILPKMTLRTNFIGKMNGPKESHQWSFGGVNVPLKDLYPNIYSKETHISCQYKLGEEVKSKIQSLCFVHSDEYNGYENEMMWAQYSENHKGVCLEIDTDLFMEENSHLDIFKFQNVRYKPRDDDWIYWDSNLTKDENIDKHIKRDFESLFLSKSHYWDKEFEKRLLMIENDRCFLKINKSLTGIYFGLFSNFNYEPSIKNLINAEKTKSYYMCFEVNRFERMEIKNMNDFGINEKFLTIS